MCKKLVLAAVAILVGTAVVRHTSFGSLAQVWWHDAKQAVERQVPPEVQIRQLKNEVKKVDDDIRHNIGRLAAQEVDVQSLETNVAELKANQAALKAEITALTKAIEEKAEKVSLGGHNYRRGEMARNLDRAVANYELRKAELKNKDQLLSLKKQALDAANDRITAMRDQKEKLGVTIAKLETRVQLNQLNATRQDVVDLDDSQVARCKELADQIDRRLTIEEKKIEISARLGLTTPASAKAEETKPTADILKAAHRAVEEETERVAAKQE